MQMISYFSSNGTSCNTTRAVKPVVHQRKLTLDVGDGLTRRDLLSPLPGGECAADAGQIVNKGCYDILLSIEYLTGADCDNCTVDAVSAENVTITVPANTAFPLPPGLIYWMQVATVDSSGNAVANTTEQTVSWYSAYAPDCAGCVAVP